MTPRDFCYFLQGPLELLKEDRSSIATQEATKEIREHLQLVFDTDIDANKYPDACKGRSFCDWLDGLLCNTGDSLTDTQLDKIQTRLSDAFRKEIDPTFVNSVQLQAIHDGRDGERRYRRDDDDEKPFDRRRKGPPVLC